MHELCPIAYDHDPDGAGCAVCGWSPAVPQLRMDPEEWAGIKAWITALNGMCSGPVQEQDARSDEP